MFKVKTDDEGFSYLEPGGRVKVRKEETLKSIESCVELENYRETSVTIEIYEGDRAMVKDNRLLGKLDLNGIRTTPNGDFQIEVTFAIDTSCLLDISAMDTCTRKQNRITINNNDTRLHMEEMKRFINNAEILRAEDEKQKKLNRTKNYLESYCLSMRSTFNDEKLFTMVGDSDRQVILKMVSDVINWLDVDESMDLDKLHDKQIEVEREYITNLTKLYLQLGGAAEDLPSGISKISISEEKGSRKLWFKSMKDYLAKLKKRKPKNRK